MSTTKFEILNTLVLERLDRFAPRLRVVGEKKKEEKNR